MLRERWQEGRGIIIRSRLGERSLQLYIDPDELVGRDDVEAYFEECYQFIETKIREAEGWEETCEVLPCSTIQSTHGGVGGIVGYGLEGPRRG